MITQTIQSLAVTLSDGGYSNFVIVDLTKATTDGPVPQDLPHGVTRLINAEKTAIEFKIDEDDDESHARDAYQEIINACVAHAGLLSGSITLVEDGEVETTTIG